jgi:hypothetical protein
MKRSCGNASGHFDRYVGTSPPCFRILFCPAALAVASCSFSRPLFLVSLYLPISVSHTFEAHSLLLTLTICSELIGWHASYHFLVLDFGS